MKYIDPFPVTCATCSERSMQRVADLLRLRAVCPSCGVILEDVGREMREGSDKAGHYWILIEVALLLEKVMCKPISDAELEVVRTLRDLARVVERHLSADPSSEDHSIALVQDAVREVSSGKAAGLALDVRLMDAVYPSRWNG